MDLSFNTAATTFWRWTILLTIGAVIGFGCWYLYAQSKPSPLFHEWLATASLNSVSSFLVWIIALGVMIGRLVTGNSK